MFLLGHACWSYLFSKASGKSLKINVPAYLAFLAGVLPDFDIYIHSFIPSFLHHTYTHSLLVIVPAVVLITYFFGRLGMAFSIGILSHLLTDSIVGTIPLFYPFYPDLRVGFGFGIPSLVDTVLEIGALGLVIVYALQNGDYKLVLRPSREGLLLGIPLVAIVTLTLLFAGDNQIPLATLAFSRRALTLITGGHVLLGAILGLGVLQGLRWYSRTKRMGTSASTTSPVAAQTPP